LKLILGFEFLPVFVVIKITPLNSTKIAAAEAVTKTHKDTDRSLVNT
jgi:hypothetical protein